MFISILLKLSISGAIDQKAYRSRDLHPEEVRPGPRQIPAHMWRERQRPVSLQNLVAKCSHCTCAQQQSYWLWQCSAGPLFISRLLTALEQRKMCTSELGTGEHCLDRRTMFSSHKIVGYYIGSLFVVAIPLRYRGLVKLSYIVALLLSRS